MSWRKKMMRGVAALMVTGLVLSFAPPADAVIMSDSDEGTIDVIIGPQNGTAYLTLTFDIQKVVSHVQRDESAVGDTKHGAEWQAYVARFPIAGMQLKTRSVLRSSILQTMKYWKNLARIEFKVSLIVPSADGSSQRRLFEAFECSDDCLTGRLPKQQHLSPWAVEQLNAEEPGSTTYGPPLTHR